MLRLSDEELEILREAQIDAKRRIARRGSLEPASLAEIFDMKREAECKQEGREIDQSTPNPVSNATRPRKGL